MRAAAVEQELLSQQRIPGNARTATVLAVVLVDLLATGLALGIAIGIQRVIFPANIAGFSAFWIPAVFVAAFALYGLYPGIAMNPVDEMRKIVTAAGIAVFFMVAGGLSAGSGNSLPLLCLTGLGSVFCATLARAGMRRVLGATSWWGIPAVVIGDSGSSARAAAYIQKHSALGLRVIGMLRHAAFFHSAPEVEATGLTGPLPIVTGVGIRYAILALPPLLSSEANGIVEQYCQRFEHVLVIPDNALTLPFWTGEKDVSGVLGFEMRQSGLHRRQNMQKRLLDLVVAAIAAVCILPIIGLIFVAIRLTSRGSGFYGSTRIGMDGKPFLMWKFRTMVQDAESVLRQYLEKHPSLMLEWHNTHKLKNDPRITPIGRILRRTSLDELPQIWNVLRGEMSLIGPRPIVTQEIPRYGEKFRLYKTVRPGLTGLWQVSGRSDTSYDQRVRYDEYYVRNWSIWLDVYILGKTPQAVCRTKGAY